MYTQLGNLLKIGNMNSAGHLDMEGEHTFGVLNSGPGSTFTMQDTEDGDVTSIDQLVNQGHIVAFGHHVL